MAAVNELIETDPDLLYARRRLERWGEWMRAITIRTLGYPTQTAFAQERTGIMVDYDDPDADEMEQLLARMMNMPARVVQYRVLVQEYCFQQSARDGCKRVKDVRGRTITRDTYLRERHRAEEYLAGILAGRGGV